MKMLICGDREWDDLAAIQHLVTGTKLWCEILGEEYIVIEGGASGADTMAGDAARYLSIEVWEIPARWERYGKAAGPRRNQVMLELLKKAASEGETVVCYAFHDDIRKSKGTADMVKRCKKEGIPTYIVGRA